MRVLSMNSNNNYNLFSEGRYTKKVVTKHSWVLIASKRSINVFSYKNKKQVFYNKIYK